MPRPMRTVAIEGMVMHREKMPLPEGPRLRAMIMLVREAIKKFRTRLA